MKTYQVALCEIARISADIRRGQDLGGSMLPRGLDLYAVACTLQLYYPEQPFEQIKRDLEDLEYEFYEQAKLK